MNQHRQILRLVELAVLLAVLLLLEVTGLGMLKTFGLELTIMQLPVIIGAIVIGPGGGAALGLAFGLISFWECFGKSTFGVALLSINPFLTFLVCVPTRTLMGFLCGLIFRGLHGLTRGKKTDLLSYLGASLGGALLNTALFMGTLCACFYRTEYIRHLPPSSARAMSSCLSRCSSACRGLWKPDCAPSWEQLSAAARTARCTELKHTIRPCAFGTGFQRVKKVFF